MRPIGGELELEKFDYYSYFTDSGRSSLRLFLRSGINNKKKYLIPNFFCKVVEDIFNEENIEYSFYNVFEDLTIDKDYINSQDYDVLYIINYFGKYIDLSGINLNEKILIEDNVFFLNFKNRLKHKQWFGFNSFRKVTSLADGSLIKTNLKIDDNLIINTKAQFVNIKYEAKRIKYNYLYNNKYEEEQYLKKFSQAENIIDNQKNIYTISSKSLYLLLDIKIDKIREKRFNKLLKVFKDVAILNTVNEYSYFPILVNNRDKLKKELAKHNIFLPIHWPKSSQINTLYDKIISIPLFNIYKDDEFEYMIKKIGNIL